jgi:hypothetical protein
MHKLYAYLFLSACGLIDILIVVYHLSLLIAKGLHESLQCMPDCMKS